MATSGKLAVAREEYSILGERLRANRVAAGISLNDLARRIGISSSELSRIETGQKKRIDFSTIDRASAALGVPLEHYAIAHRADTHEAKAHPTVKPAVDMARAQGIPEWAIDEVVVRDTPLPPTWTAPDIYQAILLAVKSGTARSGTQLRAPTKARAKAKK